ncbi:hypothetical protein K504DRAFT_491834 [Pleomassaria siparia CBS 279.74]|uniref:Uncharacterized protein n=1 Tax=Pleomassaria siparia CBS 279.74 TaxID=1314801 RepID=A0A6G1K6L6_9PLEO|nr:hypothetical protein K504DRAFT_491834 [Pleomassaria siparia CBS 279.74]
MSPPSFGNVKAKVIEGLKRDEEGHLSLSTEMKADKSYHMDMPWQAQALTPSQGGAEETAIRVADLLGNNASTGHGTKRSLNDQDSSPQRRDRPPKQPCRGGKECHLPPQPPSLLQLPFVAPRGSRNMFRKKLNPAAPTPLHWTDNCIIEGNDNDTFAGRLRLLNSLSIYSKDPRRYQQTELPYVASLTFVITYGPRDNFFKEITHIWMQLISLPVTQIRVRTKNTVAQSKDERGSYDSDKDDEFMAPFPYSYKEA